MMLVEAKTVSFCITPDRTSRTSVLPLLSLPRCRLMTQRMLRRARQLSTTLNPLIPGLFPLSWMLKHPLRLWLLHHTHPQRYPLSTSMLSRPKASLLDPSFHPSRTHDHRSMSRLTAVLGSMANPSREVARVLRHRRARRHLRQATHLVGSQANQTGHPALCGHVSALQQKVVRNQITLLWTIMVSGRTARASRPHCRCPLFRLATGTSFGKR